MTAVTVLAPATPESDLPKRRLRPMGITKEERLLAVPPSVICDHDDGIVTL
jgi:hypothetical protein